MQSTRGMVFLLDHGFGSYYPRVQHIIEQALGAEISGQGLGKNVKPGAERARIRGAERKVIIWNIECVGECDLIKINLALTGAVRRLGAAVRSSRESDDGETLFFEAGSRKAPTQRIVIRRSGAISLEKQRDAVGTSEFAMLSLVIDDFGYSRNGIVNAFMSLDLPLTLSVIPSLLFSSYSLERAEERGKEVILHLPMEPENKVEYDVPPVTTAMSGRDIGRMVEEYVSELPGIKGVNNHMGSKATTDTRVMKAVMKVLKDRRLFFLDSLTSPRSVAYNTAVDAGVPAERNDLFIDAGTEDPSVIEKRLQRLIDIAKIKGHAVGIGHPRPWTLEALKNSEALLKNSGIHLVFLSRLVETRSSD